MTHCLPLSFLEQLDPFLPQFLGVTYEPAFLPVASLGIPQFPLIWCANSRTASRLRFTFRADRAMTLFTAR